MKKLYILLLVLFASQAVSAQEIDYSRKWFLGFNWGTTWHTTDVKNVNNYGWGLTLGKSYGYSYGAPISWDIRGRFLKGWWYGQDIDSTGANGYNQTLGSGSTNYYDSLGFGVHNFQNENYKLNLELVMHANRFRARTGWDPYIFVGAGLSINQAYGDYTQYDTTGGVSTQELYAYDGSQISKSYLKEVQDGVYETALDGHDQKRFNVQFMPSIGLGIGRHFGPGHTIGLEHKTTFTLDDKFDGVQVASKYSTDIYHYTNLYLQFRLRSRDKEEVVELPEVEFTDPNVERKVVNDPVYIVKAVARHIDSRENLTFTMNNRVLNDFVYNPDSDQFASEVRLKVGENILHLAGVNAFGSDDDQVIIVYEVIDEPTPPQVDFIQPGNSNIRVNQSRFAAVAEVVNVDTKQQIKVSHNNRQVLNFDFDSIHKTVRFNVQLMKGANTLRVDATNKDGQANDQVIIHYEEQVQVQKSIVQFTSPARSNMQVSDPNFNVRAVVRHVDDRIGVSFKFNGRAYNSFSFDPNRDEFTSNVRLVPGQNILEIVGTNEAGQAQTSTVINLIVNDPKPPVVSISNPRTSTDVVSNAPYVFVGRALNVRFASQITLVINGRQQQSFDFDPQSGQVSKSLTLIEGNNDFQLIATNDDGTDNQSARVVYRKTTTVDPPQVDIYSPTSNPFQTQNPSQQVYARIDGVTQSNQIEVQLNGRVVSGWSFSNGVVSYNAPLIEGANVVEVAAENQAGSDDDQIVIRYTKPQTVDPPVVTFTDPIRSPYYTSEGRKVVKATVKNVDSKDDITVRINGQQTTSFAFLSSSESLSFNTGLDEGSNVIEIIATNQGGNDRATTTIVYRPVVQTDPPTVNIIDPSRSPLVVNTVSANVRAVVSNIEQSNQLEVTVNGVKTNNFSFDASEETVELSVRLNEGNNSVQIKATNTSGSASDAASIKYEKPIEQKPPTVSFISPESPGTNVSTNQFNFVAKVMEIDNARQLVIRHNGQVVLSGYRYDLSNKQLTFPLTLQNGNNVVEVEGTNDVGSAKETTSVNYQRKNEPCDKPIITVIEPTKNTVSVTKEAFVARFTVQGSTANEIRASYNGSYKAVEKTMSGYQVVVNLNQGLNSIELKASNKCGFVTELISVKYVPSDDPCDRPTIHWINPNDSVATTESSTFDLNAAVREIQSASNIQFKVNGQVQSGSYDAASGTFTKSLSLVEGWNTIQLTATNSCGSTGSQIQIRRIPCVAPSFNLEQASVANGGQTYGNSLSLTIDVNDVPRSNQLQVKLNGRYQGVNYNTATNKLSVNVGLVVGSNTVEVIANTDCGNAIYRHAVTRKQAAPKTPPSVELIKPTKGKNTVDQALQSVQMKVKNVQSKSDLVFKVNGRVVGFSFSEKTGVVSATVKLRTGQNHIVVSAANNNGSASAELFYTYQPKVVVQKPVITINMPKSPTTTVGTGLQIVKGSASGLQNGGTLTATVNGRTVRMSKKQIGSQTQFTFAINVSSTHGKYVVEVRARNASGTDVEKRTFVLKATSSGSTIIKKPTDIKKPNKKGTITVPTRGGN